MRWVSIPPIVALALLLVVSFFGAQVVLRGLAPGWAAVDVASALLVVALMVAAATIACIRMANSRLADQPEFTSSFTKLLLATVAVIYIVLFTGVLMAGKGSFTGCLGWPIYNLQQFQLDGHFPANTVRIILSVIGLGMLVAVLGIAWMRRQKERRIYSMARWVGLAFLAEAGMQVVLQIFGLLTSLLLAYTVVAAAFWALLVALLVNASLKVASK
jgi:heme A synthase